MEARTVHVTIGKPWREVCDFLAEPCNYPRWASWLGPELRRDARGDWIARRPGGRRAKVRFTERNAFGVADHCLVEGEDHATFVALRAVPHDEGCEVMATFFLRDGWTDERLSAAQRDLDRLRSAL